MAFIFDIVSYLFDIQLRFFCPEELGTARGKIESKG
jgi:hypothetical protein